MKNLKSHKMSFKVILRLLSLTLLFSFLAKSKVAMGQQNVKNKVLFNLLSESDSEFIYAKKIFLVKKASHFYDINYIKPMLNSIDLDSSNFNKFQGRIDSINVLDKTWKFKNRKFFEVITKTLIFLILLAVLIFFINPFSNLDPITSLVKNNSIRIRKRRGLQRSHRPHFLHEQFEMRQLWTREVHLDRCKTESWKNYGCFKYNYQRRGSTPNPLNHETCSRLRSLEKFKKVSSLIREADPVRRIAFNASAAERP